MDSVSLRVHFAPIGYEVDRVVHPLKVMRADRAVLICAARTGKAAQYHDAVADQLKTLGIGYHTIDCNFWEVALVVDIVGGIMAAAPEHDYYYNASTGAKTCAVAGITAATFWPLRPYYQPVQYEERRAIALPDLPAVGTPFSLPTFHVPALDEDALRTLRFLYTQIGDVSKRDLMEHLKSEEIIGPRKQKEVTPQALHAQADAILERLRAREFIRTEGKGQTLRLHLTDKGRAGSTMFQHILNPVPRLGILNT